MARSVGRPAKPLTRMLRIDDQFAHYLLDRAAREKVTVPDLTRRILRAIRLHGKAWTP